jgi:hypothetical protein
MGHHRCHGRNTWSLYQRGVLGVGLHSGAGRALNQNEFGASRSRNDESRILAACHSSNSSCALTSWSQRCRSWVSSSSFLLTLRAQTRKNVDTYITQTPCRKRHKRAHRLSALSTPASRESLSSVNVRNGARTGLCFSRLVCDIAQRMYLPGSI